MKKEWIMVLIILILVFSPACGVSTNQMQGTTLSLTNNNAAVPSENDFFISFGTISVEKNGNKTAIDGSTVYYITEQGLYAYDLVKHETSCIVSADNLTTVYANHGELYWIAVKPSGTENQQQKYIAELYVKRIDDKEKLLWSSKKEYHSGETPSLLRDAFDNSYSLFRYGVIDSISTTDKYILLDSVNELFILDRATGDFCSYYPVSDFQTLTAGNDIVFHQHNGDKTALLSFNILGSSENVVEEVWRKCPDTAQNGFHYTDVCACNNEVFYTTAQPYAVWQANKAAGDRVILDFEEEDYSIQMFPSEDCIYIVVYRQKKSVDKPDGHITIYKYSVSEQQITESKNCFDIYNKIGLKVVNDYLFFFSDDGFMIRNLF